MKKPKVSIITVVYNGAKTLSQCIESVLSQDYNNIEYIVVDGNSKDDTVQIIQLYDTRISKWISEPDKGIYDAMNKGIHLATGEIVGILNADDFYANSQVIQQIVTFFEEKQVDAVCSSVAIFKDESFDKIWRFYNAKKFKLWQFRMGIQPPHPGFFVKKSCYDSFGDYDIKLKISGDFDMLLRLLWVHKISAYYTSFTSVKMRDGGISSNSFSSKVLMNKEDLIALKKYGIYSNQLLIWLKYPIKAFQLVFKS